MTYSQYNKFRIFAEAATTDVSTGSNGIIRDDDKWINYDARTSGLLPGDFISSITLNTALRQATFMSTLLAESIANSNIVNDEISTSNLNNAVEWAKPVGTALRYGYNLTTNDIHIGGNYRNTNGEDTFTVHFGPVVLQSTVINNKYLFSGYNDVSVPLDFAAIKSVSAIGDKYTVDGIDYYGVIQCAKLDAGFGTLNMHPAVIDYDDTLDSRIVTMQELRNASWLRGGYQITATETSHYNLNNATTVGNYYCPTDDNAIYVDNKPITINNAFTLKVSSGNDTNSQYLQQQITQCDTGNTYIRISTNGGNTWGDWAVIYNTNTAAIINFTRDVALQCGCTENSDHTITVPVKALIQCATNNYSTRACLRVGGVGGTVESNPSYFGIQIEGLPKLDDFLVHLDMKFYNSDTWITLEQTTKTYQCFYNSNYFAETVNGQPNPYYNAKPIWIYVPRTGNRTQFTTGGVIPDAPTGNIGSNNQPVYLSDGVITPCTYTIKVDNTIPDTLDNNTIYFVTEG